MEQTVDRPVSLDDADQYELACRAAGIGVWELHVGDDRLAYSDIARSIFSFPQEGPVTREMVHGSIHPDDLDVVLSAARRAMDPGVRANEHYVYRVRRLDTGELRWLRGRGIAQFDGEGSNARAVLYAGSVQDITGRELTRQSLAASEERLRLAIDAAEMAVWDLDLEAGVVAHSPELNRLLGFPEDASPSLDELRSRYAPGERERLEAEGAAARARGETSLQTRVRYIVPGRGEVTYVLRAALAQTPMLNSSRQRVIGVLFDATEEARAERRLVTMTQELRHRLKTWQIWQEYSRDKPGAEMRSSTATWAAFAPLRCRQSSCLESEATACGYVILSSGRSRPFAATVTIRLRRMAGHRPYRCRVHRHRAGHSRTGDERTEARCAIHDGWACGSNLGCEGEPPLHGVAGA
ncbi:hypothetical protein EF888_16970 [Silicimonas algicola]|nr:hypothetical protein [Silicimonas algicola]AZQ68672.1 hypothetical protein EF888_16970 [Silicimonas algicola]